MAQLIFEIWEWHEDGMVLNACEFAGPRGDEARNWHGENAKLLATFPASSHFEAMTIYNEYLGREKYKTIYEQDYLPYPEEWYHEQNAALGKEEIRK